MPIVTFFRDYAARIKREEQLTREALAKIICAANADTKGELPWIKCSRFGGQCSERGSLRHNDNLIAITGIEADYDGKRMPFEDAVAILHAAGISAIVYTSPSFTEDGPKWRVLCFLSREYPPANRDRLLARLNGLFGGIFAPESWTISQAYYFGSVRRNPSHRVVVIEGDCIDLRDDLDAAAIGRPEKPQPLCRSAHPVSDQSRITDARLNGLVTKLLGNISNAPKGTVHNTLLIQARTLGGYAHLLPYSEAELISMLLTALPADANPDPVNERKTARDGLHYGMCAPLDLEERPQVVPLRDPAAARRYALGALRNASNRVAFGDVRTLRQELAATARFTRTGALSGEEVAAALALAAVQAGLTESEVVPAIDAALCGDGGA